jgi:sphingomyelin phosphodiesterase
MYDSFDPSGQLMWLAGELLAAEQKAQKVHILAHNPDGITSVWSTCSREYRRIIDRSANANLSNLHTQK